MALIDPTKRKRFDIPHEPGEWIELRHISAAEYVSVSRELDMSARSLELCKLSVCGWSYDVPVSAETVGQLDVPTLVWLDSVLVEGAGLRTEAEKNDSGGSSPPASATVEPSPTSLDT